MIKTATNADKKPVKKSAMDWIREIQDQAATELGDKVEGSTLDAATLSAIVERIGRPLTRNEIYFNRLQREGDNGNFWDRLGKWTPKKHDPNANLPDDQRALVEEIAKLEEEKADKAFFALSGPDQMIEMHKRDLAKLQEAAKAKADYDTWLSSEAVAMKLKRLKELDERSAFDPAFNWDETVTIAKAIAAIEGGPGIDTDDALQLAKEAFEIDKGKKVAAMSEREQAIAALVAELDAQKQALADLGYIDSPAAPPGQQAANDDQQQGGVTPPPGQQATDNVRAAFIQQALLAALKPIVVNDNVAELLVGNLAKSAKVNDRGNAITVDIDGKTLDPQQVVAHMQSQPAKYGPFFKINVPAMVPVTKTTATHKASGKKDLGSMTLEEIRSAAQSDSEVGSLVAAATR